MVSHQTTPRASGYWSQSSQGPLEGEDRVGYGDRSRQVRWVRQTGTSRSDASPRDARPASWIDRGGFRGSPERREVSEVSPDSSRMVMARYSRPGDEMDHDRMVTERYRVPGSPNVEDQRRRESRRAVTRCGERIPNRENSSVSTRYPVPQRSAFRIPLEMRSRTEGSSVCITRESSAIV